MIQSHEQITSIKAYRTNRNCFKFGVNQEGKGSAYRTSYSREEERRLMALLEAAPMLRAALERIATMEPYQHSRTCCEMHRIANEALIKLAGPQHACMTAMDTLLWDSLGETCPHCGEARPAK